MSDWQVCTQTRTGKRCEFILLSNTDTCPCFILKRTWSCFCRSGGCCISFLPSVGVQLSCPPGAWASAAPRPRGSRTLRSRSPCGEPGLLESPACSGNPRGPESGRTARYSIYIAEREADSLQCLTVRSSSRSAPDRAASLFLFAAQSLGSSPSAVR